MGDIVIVEEYRTLKQAGYAELVEKKSRFLGFSCPVRNEEEAIAYVNRIRASHSEARHVAYAYHVSCQGMMSQRYSDDGEPQGTAGLPILDVLRKQELVNAAVAVVRYFGGILLGAPGLARAYGKSASLAVRQSGICRMTRCVPVLVTVEYSDYGSIQRLMEDRRLRQDKPPVFDSSVTVSCFLPVREAERICREFTEATAGRLLLERGESVFFPLEEGELPTCSLRE